MKEKKIQKRLAVVLILAIIIGVNIPVKVILKDGGSVRYSSILWSYTKYHRLQEGESGYFTGKVFRFIPFNYIEQNK